MEFHHTSYFPSVDDVTAFFFLLFYPECLSSLRSFPQITHPALCNHCHSYSFFDGDDVAGAGGGAIE